MADTNLFQLTQIEYISVQTQLCEVADAVQEMANPNREGRYDEAFVMSGLVKVSYALAKLGFQLKMFDGEFWDALRVRIGSQE